MNFLILQEKLVDYNKKIIDKGLTPQKIYQICSCVRETFCLSYSIRKNNSLYLYFQKEHALVKFEGKTLRYLGPDERSQALLLEKALIKVKREIKTKNDTWIKSTPGIFVKKFMNISSFIDFYESIALGKRFLILNNSQFEDEIEDVFNINNKFIEIKDNDFFIIPNNTLSKENSRIIELFKKAKNTKLLSFSKIKDLEDKILYVNFKKDQQRSLQK